MSAGGLKYYATDDPENLFPSSQLLDGENR